MKRFEPEKTHPPARTSLILRNSSAWDGHSVPSPPSTLEIAKGAFVLVERIPRTPGIRSAAFSRRSRFRLAREDTDCARAQAGDRGSRSRGSGACRRSGTNHNHKEQEGTQRKRPTTKN